ncbi:MAG: hypothetical protein ACHQQ3_08685 [Gemmatimonadales bacterium]
MIPTSRKSLARATVVAAALSFLAVARAAAQDIPSRLADSTFWRMVTEYSEAGGYFRSDNFVSNETSYQYVIPELQKTIQPGTAYLGVAPDQNFTYIIALKPKIAFLFDIRRQMVMQQLMYKALIELSADRVEFMSRLFSRPRPVGVDGNSSVDALMAAFSSAQPDSTYYRKNWSAIKDRLAKVHGFSLSDSAFSSIEYVYDAFYTAGPAITYNFGQGGRGGGFAFNGGYGRNMPTYATLMVETDGTGLRRSYLASEANYRYLKEMETNNLIVPVVGDFAGAKAIRNVGQYLKAHNATVGAFYVSNVEQYLFQGEQWRRFYDNVATLPFDSSSQFIRSLSQANMGGFHQQSPNSRSLQLVCSIAELLKAFNEGKVTQYWDVILMSHQ